MEIVKNILSVIGACTLISAMIISIVFLRLLFIKSKH